MTTEPHSTPSVVNGTSAGSAGSGGSIHYRPDFQTSVSYSIRPSIREFFNQHQWGIDPPNTADPAASPSASGPPDEHVERWLVGLLAALGSACVGRKWQCPAHARAGDHSVALSVGTRRDGTGAWLFCHGGCEWVEVLRALALTPNHLRRPPPVSPEKHAAAHRLATKFPPPRSTGGSGGTPAEAGYLFEAFHEYGDDVRMERLRRPTDGAKTLRWERRNPAGEWVPGLPEGVRVVDLPLYRERDAVMGAAAGEPVLLVESESSVDALTGFYATTWAGGASAPPLERIAEVLGDTDVVIVPDRDDAGLACCARLIEALPQARVLLGEPDEDARDLLDRVGRREFERLVARAPRAVEPISDPEEKESA